MANPDGMPETHGTDGEARTDNDIVQEAKARWQICQDGEDRSEAMEDLRFKKGDQWTEEAVRQRELDNRPCLTINNIPAITHQVTNDARMNKQSIHVAPVDDGADVKVAEVIEGLIRHIEYDSQADAAYDTAIASAADIGFGFFRVVTEYCDEKSFNQDIKIKRIRNPFTVHIDPNAQEADGSDMRFAFISTRISKGEFERTYPKASMTSGALGTATGDNDNWLWPDYVRIAEYYRIEEEDDTLHMLPDGSTVLESDPKWKAISASGIKPIATRSTTRSKVMWYKLTGYEVLEKAEIPCKWIPIFPVYGDEVDIDGEVTRWGLIRNAKSPKQMENYWMTSATEEIALRTKTPFIGALGQFEGVEDDWEQANIRNFAYLEYNPVTIDGTIAPAPQRQAPADVPTGFLQMAAMSRDAVKAVTAIYDAQLGARSNEVSGLAIKARQQQGGLGNYHFGDNLSRAICHLARCLIWMIPRVYDASRVVRTLGVDRKTAKFVQINQPQAGIDPDTGQAIQTVLNDLTVGQYDVTVSAGPGYDTQRQEGAANMIELGGKWPPLMNYAGDKVIAEMDFPGAPEIAELVKEGLIKAGTRAPDAEDDQDEPMVQTPKGPMSIQQAGQVIAQLDQHSQQLTEALDKANKGIPGKQIDAQTDIEVARIQAESRERIAAMTIAGKHDDTELAGIIELIVAKAGNQAAAVEALRSHFLEIEKEGAVAAIQHGAAVASAQDPDHPAPDAATAQEVAAAPLNPAPEAGNEPSASNGE